MVMPHGALFRGGAEGKISPDNRYFERAKTVDGTIVWPHGQDICPDTLYLDSVCDE